jgi:hypothetical protein
METDGGGWTRLAYEDFETGASGWSTTNNTTTCGDFGTILGGYGEIAGTTNEKTFNLNSVSHSEVRVTLDYLTVDSWDGEEAFVTVDGSKVFTNNHCFCSQDCQNNGGTCGGRQQCGNTSHKHDRLFPVDETVSHSSGSVTIGGGSTLDQPATDESWGMDDVEVFVR